jgi:hypothetical protein
VTRTQPDPTVGRNKSHFRKKPASFPRWIPHA